MLDSIKSLFAELAGGQKQAGQFRDNDYRLAAAALLVHAVNIDGDGSEVKRTKLHHVLQYRFDLSDDDTEELIDVATTAESQSVDLYHFTSLIGRTLDEEGRCRVVEMMWEIIYADGRVDELEDNLVWRVADLLGVSSRERINLRRQVAAETTVDPRALKAKRRP
jgi:uncharacterized tellurite resistance protein B-like protein